MQAGLSTQNAPSPGVVLPHFVFGAVAFIIAAVVLILYPADMILPYHLNAKMLTLTHIMVLGFITMIIMGALYQLIPVVMEVKLFSERMAKATFVLFATGLTVLIINFWEAGFGPDQNWLWFEISGTIILAAVFLFVFNTLKSAAKSEVKNTGNLFVKTAIVYLLITVLLAITMIINFARPFIPVSAVDLLKMHMHLGLVGWFLFLVIGVSSKLIPMFLIIHKLPEKYLKYSYYFLNAGIVLLVTAFSFYPVLWALSVASLFLLSGVIFYLRFIQYAFKHRFRKNLDVGMTWTGVAFWVLTAVLFVAIFALINPGMLGLIALRIQIAYGMTFIFGFLTVLILAQTYKTLPFIVWLDKYQSKVGRQKTPMPHELYSEKIAKIHMQTFVLSFALLVAGELAGMAWLIRIAGVVLLFTAFLYAYNVMKIVFHKEKIMES